VEGIDEGKSSTSPFETSAFQVSTSPTSQLTVDDVWEEDLVEIILLDPETSASPLRKYCWDLSEGKLKTSSAS